MLAQFLVYATLNIFKVFNYSFYYGFCETCYNWNGFWPDSSNEISNYIFYSIPLISKYISQIKQFRKLLNPYNEPNRSNFRPLQPREDRTVFFISPHWSQYNSLLPLPRLPEPSISVLSNEYSTKLWMLPRQNAYMIPDEPKNDENSEARRPSGESQWTTTA